MQYIRDKGKDLTREGLCERFPMYNRNQIRAKCRGLRRRLETIPNLIRDQ